MSAPLHPRLATWMAVVEVLEAIARDYDRGARRAAGARKGRAGRGGTLRPSAETPLWNALAGLVKPRLRRRGDRALLARELGVHRARIGEFFDRESAMPDAERALRILVWLSREMKSAAPEGKGE